MPEKAKALNNKDAAKLDQAVIQSLVDNTHDGIVIIGDEFLIEFVNRRSLELLGYDKEDLIGHDFREFLTKESIEMMSHRYVQRRTGKNPPSTYAFEMYRKDSSIMIGDIRVEVVNTNTGHQKSIAHVQDITERRAEQRALEEIERRNEIIVENMNDGMAMDDEEGILLYVNDSFCEMLGYTRDELIGKTWSELTESKDTEFVQEMINERKTGKTARYELCWIRKSGESVYTIVSASPYYDSKGGYIGSFAVITDISEQKETEEAVQFYLDLLTHDIANQLQVIITSTGLMDTNLPESYAKDAQQDILDAVERCNRLITKVKRAGQLRMLPHEEMDLSRVIKEKIPVVEKVYSAKVNVSNFQDPIIVRADVLLGELIWNLLENAARHNPKKDRQIWVSGNRHKGMYELVVEDNGPGISNKRKKILFDRGKRAGGVGLALISQMARKYGGKVDVLDRVKGEPGKGAKFVLSLIEVK